jgi:hypothetical protein
MTREEFNNQLNATVSALIEQSMRDYAKAQARVETVYTDVLDHIGADGPCSYGHVRNFVQAQLPDGIDTGEILEGLINRGLIVFSHMDQAYEVAA